MDKKKAGPSFITIRQAVDLLAEAHGAATSAAAAQLIDMLNDAVHEGRPALYERDGPALKVVSDPGERYVAVIQSLDALRRGPPADDRNDPLANTRRDLRRRRMVRAGIPGASWYDTEFTLYPRKIAVLELVEVRAAEFERFALTAPDVSSASLAAVLHQMPAAISQAEPVPTTGGATESQYERKKRLLDRVNYWKGRGVKDFTQRVATEEGISAGRVRQILQEPKQQSAKPAQTAVKKPLATFCSGLDPSSRSTR